MLNEEDVTKIRKLIREGLIEFYETIFEPYANHNDKQHEEILAEMRKGFKENEKDHELMFRHMDRSREEHDRMIEMLEKREKAFEKKLKRLEAKYVD